MATAEGQKSLQADSDKRRLISAFGDRTLRKHGLFKYTDILPPNTENFQIKKKKKKKKKTVIFHISAQNIDCEYSLEPPWPRNMKNNVYPCKPQFYCIKEGFKRVKII